MTPQDIISVSSQIVPLQGVVCSRQGGRPENQDDWGIFDTPLGCLLIVCDGMGGGPGGKTASYIVTQVIASTLLACSPQTSRTDALKMAVSKANDALYQKMYETPSLQGMGSTMVAILINAYSIVVAHLGDSRCYRISRGRVFFRTDDHSLVGELVRNKAMTEEQARVSPQSNVITRGLGNTNNHVAEITEIPYLKGDRLILCTDGVWGIMPHDQLVQRLTSQQDLNSLVSNLSAEIDQRGFAEGGRHDNHTLVVVEMNSDSVLKDKMSKYIKIILGILSTLLVVSVIVNIVCFNKIDEMPEIAKLEQRNQELKKNMALYQDVKTEGTKELITKVEVLQIEKELLEDSQNALIEKIDSLEKVIIGMQQENRSVTQSSVKTEKASGPSAKELAQSVINLFEAMVNVKGKTEKEAVKKKVECRTRIVEKLTMFNKKTNGKFSSVVSQVNNELRSDTNTDKVMQTSDKNSNTVYVSTYHSKNKIQELSKKISDIKNKL